MARHLLDSDILIWVLRGKAAAVDFVRNLLKEEVPAISTVSVYEIWSGIRSRHEEDIVSEFLSGFSILPVTPEIAKEGAHYYREFRKKGMTLSMADALIAGTARTHQVILITQNQKDFPMTDIEKSKL